MVSSRPRSTRRRLTWETKVAKVINDLTDEDGIEHFRSVTITQAAA
jgi:hypothetical protein